MSDAPDRIAAAVAKWTPEQAASAKSLFDEHPEDPDLKRALQIWNAGGSEQPDGDSVRKSLARPPEFIPPQSPGIRGFLNLLPSYVGGGTEHVQEPSKEQFLKLFGGKPPEGFDVEQGYKDYADALWAQKYDQAKAEGRPVVRHQRMMDVVDTENPVLQMLKPATKFVGDVQDAAVGDVGSLAHTALLGMDEPVVAGLGKLGGYISGENPQASAENALSDYRASKERSPLKKDMELLGAFAPDTLAAAGIGKILGAAGRTGGAISSTLKGGAAGAATGGAARGLSNYGENLANEIAGNGEPAKDITEGVGSGALLGGGFGALGGLLGGLGRSLRSGPNGADLRNVEAAGGETSVLQGVKLPKAVEQNLEQAAETRSNPVDVAAANVRGEFANAAEKRNAALLKDIVDRKEQYFNSREGKTPIQPMPLIRALMDEVEGGKYMKGLPNKAPAAEPVVSPESVPETSGQATGAENPAAKGLGADKEIGATGAASPVAKGNPGAKPDLAPAQKAVKPAYRRPTQVSRPDLPFADSKEFADALNATVSAKVVPTEAAKGGAQFGDGAFALPAEQAANRGFRFDIPENLRDRPISDLSVIVQPRQMTARDVDRVQKLIDKAAKVASKKGGTDEAYNRLTRAIRETRDKFRPNEFAPEELKATLNDGKQVTGWSALNHLESERLGDMKKTLENAGVRNVPKDFNAADVEKPIGDTIRKYKYGEGRYDADRALEDLARDVPGGLKKLATVTATRVGPKLQEKAAIIPNLPMVGGGMNVGPLMTAAQFRLDPLARIAPQLTTAGIVGGATGNRGTETYRHLRELAPSLLAFAQRLQAEQGNNP